MRLGATGVLGLATATWSDGTANVASLALPVWLLNAACSVLILAISALPPGRGGHGHLLVLPCPRTQTAFAVPLRLYLLARFPAAQGQWPALQHKRHGVTDAPDRPQYRRHSR